MSERNIFEIIKSADKKDYGLYDELSDTELKALSSFMLLKWMPSVTASYDVQAYYLMSVNHNMNEYFFDVQKHPKLQWLMCVASSPNIGTPKHYWAHPKKKNEKKNDLNGLLRELYPTAKYAEIELMEKLYDREHIKCLAREHGWQESEIKKYTK